MLTSLVFALAGCGGGDDSASPAETETAVPDETTEDEVVETEALTDTEVVTDEEPGGAADTSGPAPAAGQGRLTLDHGRAFAITISECEFDPRGPFTVDGTSDDGAAFAMTQFYLGGEWSQSQVSLEYPSRDQIYVIVTSAREGAEPATVEGKCTWTQTFSELDESENRNVYTGEGTVQLTCQ